MGKSTNTAKPAAADADAPDGAALATENPVTPEAAADAPHSTDEAAARPEPVVDAPTAPEDPEAGTYIAKAPAQHESAGVDLTSFLPSGRNPFILREKQVARVSVAMAKDLLDLRDARGFPYVVETTPEEALADGVWILEPEIGLGTYGD